MPQALTALQYSATATTIDQDVGDVQPAVRDHISDDTAPAVHRTIRKVSASAAGDGALAASLDQR
jgi:hypothetical protein